MKKTINKYKPLLKKEVQNILLKKGLKDSGDLINSIDIEIIIKDNIEIKLIAEEYFIYLDEGTKFIEPYEIYKEFEESKIYQEATEELFFAWTEEKMDKILKKNKL
jgi:hypothetical protein